MNPFHSRVLFLLLGLSLQVPAFRLFSSEIEKDIIQTKTESTPFGRHSILTADTVELEFKMDPTKVDRIAKYDLSTNAEIISQQVGVGSLWKLGSSSQLSHQFLLGVKQETFGNDPIFGQEETQRYQQKQVTAFTTKPAEPLKLTLTNEVTNERSSESELNTQILKQGSALEYSMPFGIGLRPEVIHETVRNELKQETDRNTAYFGMKKEILPGQLNLQLKPGVAREEQLYDGGQNSEAGNLDLNLAWKPDSSTEWIWGTRAQQTGRDVEMTEEQMKGVYGQFNCKLWSDLVFRMRGDVQNTQKVMEGGGMLSDESNMNVNFGPSMVLGENFTAGAELGLHSRYDHINSLQTNEQTLSISFKGSF